MRAPLAAACSAIVLTACSVRPVTFVLGDEGPSDAGISIGESPENDAPEMTPADDAADGLATATITTHRSGAATGIVSAESVDFRCTDICSGRVAIGTTVTLVARPDVGAVFGGWDGGGCTGTDATCTVTVTEDRDITGRFDAATFTVDITTIGGGGGVVTSSDGRVGCPGPACRISVPYNTTVELFASPTQGSSFAGWGGPCSEAGTCVFTVTANTSVTAGFAANNDMIILRTGDGHGVVRSNPTGISCGDDCSHRFVPGTVIALSATADTDSTFVEWSGEGCTGDGMCLVTMDTAVTVTARFSLRQHTLGVLLSGNGSGSVRSNPGGISCGTDCTEPYDNDKVVTLLPTPATGSTFTGWSGACSGNGVCTVSMTSARSVTAMFSLVTEAIVVTNYANSPTKVAVFAKGADGDAAPLRVIEGAATRLERPRDVAVVNDEIIVVDEGAGAIAVFPLFASGNVAPTRRIAGSETGLAPNSGADGVAVFGGEIYVGQRNNTILVFRINATGNVPPARTIIGNGDTTHLVIANSEIYATSAGTSRIQVFPVGASGMTAPTRTIFGPNTLLRAAPVGIAVHDGEIFVATRNPPQILVFPQMAKDDAAPVRKVMSTALTLTEQVSIAAGELYVTNFGNSVLVFPLNANGNDVMPTRQITGTMTGLAVAAGLFLTF